MMKVLELRECVALTDAILAGVLGAVPGGATSEDDGALKLRRTVGLAQARAEEHVKAATLGDQLALAFNAALAAGATFNGLRRIISGPLSAATVSPFALAIQQCAKQMTAAAVVTVTSTDEFESRDDAEQRMRAVLALFSDVETDAADGQDPLLFQTIITMRGACVRDLTDRARQLPKIVPYDVADVLPSLALAQRLFGDALRAGDLVSENKPEHPAFMASTGKALSDA